MIFLQIVKSASHWKNEIYSELLMLLVINCIMLPLNGKGVLYVGEMFGAFMKIFGFFYCIFFKKNIR